MQNELPRLEQVLAEIKDPGQIKELLSDLSSSFEFKTLDANFKAAFLLTKGVTYRDTSERTGLSLATIAKVAHRLEERRGLQTALNARNWKPDRMTYINRAKYYD